MDGTLVDTEPYWFAAETELVESFGGTWGHEDALGLIGSGLWESAAVFRDLGVALDDDAIVERLTAGVRAQFARHGAPWRPGARELLEALRAAGVPTALVTMSIRSMADDVVSAIGFDAFDAIVTGDAVERPKPFPDPYLEGARLLGVDIAACVAIEDSRHGVASGVASGALTLGVPNIVPLDGSGAHALWPTLAGRGVEDLAALLADRAGARA
ncbi:HAD family phosphatase [Agromyces archimandritae]|uniref:HAD family phosphatase n=2 Tax=Agromyces archimandritae TaxID=2781962 RepID=A0A975IPW4_9MICO|nr:HAD family phosphatase [Agromyces archimandritae]